MNEVAQIERGEVAAPAETMMAGIERIIAMPDLPVERLEKMLDMQERIMDRQARAEYAEAKAAAFETMPTVPMNGRGHNGKPYATLKDITVTTRKPLAGHGLSLSFSTEIVEAQLVVTAKLMHRNGHAETVSLPLPMDNSGSKNSVQAIGSSQTYGQRYTAQAILGLSLGEDDDDGALAGAGERITADQFQNLHAKIEDAGADEAALCKHFKIEHLEELPRKFFGNADAMLDQKIAKAKADA